MRAAAPFVIAVVCRAVCAQTMTVEEYLRGLERLRGDLEEGDLVEVRRRAGGLLNRKVRYRDGWISPDRTVLSPLAGGGDIGQARKQSGRLGVLAEAIRGERGRVEDGALPDPALLEELRKQEEIAEIEKGGRVPGTLPKNTCFMEWLADRLAALGKWTAEQLRKLAEWLEKFLPRRRTRPVPRLSLTKLMVVALIIVVVISLAFVAYYVLRKGGGRRAPGEVAASGPAPPARDEDALSRSAAGWEKYAEELAAAGRAREATRAWYHAVLVTLYRAGVLHYRKGRTNWEYAYSLPPELPWRPRFIDVTRTFERKWYGREGSTLEGVRTYARAAGEILDAVRGHSTPRTSKPSLDPEGLGTEGRGREAGSGPRPGSVEGGGGR